MDAHECQPMGVDSVRSEIRMSWRRAELVGVRPHEPIDRLAVGEVDESSRLMVAARPVLGEMSDQLSGTRFCVLLGDGDCRIAHRWFDSPDVERALDNISAVPGTQFTEETAGTNGLGTAVEVRDGIVVHGDEHYVDSLKKFSCYGHPIKHPLTKRIEGVLDITGITKDANPMLAPFLVRAVRDIERRLLEGARMSERLLLQAFQTAILQRSRPVAALGEDVVLTNKAAIDLLDASDHGMLRALAADAVSDTWSRQVTLASGVQVRVRAQRVTGAESGTLLRFDRVTRAHFPVQRGIRVPSGETPLSRRLRELRDAGGPVLVAGEPGSGRTTAVREIAGGREVRTIDATSVAVLGEQAWARRFGELAGEDRPLAVEEIQLLPDTLCALVAKTVSERGDLPTLLTCGPADELRPRAASLAASCRGRADLPPLRDRVDELPELVRSLLAEIRPKARIRCTSSVLEALAAQSWPGNLRELAVVLRQATERRSAGDVTPDDLPPAYRAAPRSLRLAGRERAERAAIVTALRDTGGNKVHAAEQLGISRTTLYSRMRALGIAR